MSHHVAHNTDVHQEEEWTTTPEHPRQNQQVCGILYPSALDVHPYAKTTGFQARNASFPRPLAVLLSLRYRSHRPDDRAVAVQRAPHC